MSNNFYINYKALANGFNWNPQNAKSTDSDSSKINGRNDLKDGLTKEEMEEMDANGDGLLTEAEFKAKFNDGNNYSDWWQNYTSKNTKNFGVNPDGSKWQDLDPNDKRTTTTVYKSDGKTVDYYIIRTQNTDGSQSNHRYKADGSFHYSNKIYTYDDGSKMYYIYSDKAQSNLLRTEYYNEFSVATGYAYKDSDGYNCLVTYDETTGKPTSFVKTDSSGKEIYKEEYENDKYDKDRTCVKIYNDGELTNEVYYNNGMPVKQIEYSADGKVFESHYSTDKEGNPAIRKYDISQTPNKLISNDIVEIYEYEKDEDGFFVYNEIGQKIRKKIPEGTVNDDRNAIWSKFPQTMFNSFYEFNGTVASKIQKEATNGNNSNMITFTANNIKKAESFAKTNSDYGLNDYNLLETSTSKDNKIEELRQKVLDATNENERALYLVEYEVALQNSYNNKSNSLDTETLVKQITQRNTDLIKKEKNTRVKNALEKLNKLLADYPEKTKMTDINKQLQEIRNAKLAVM